SPLLWSVLVDQIVVELLSGFHSTKQPKRNYATTSPNIAVRPAILGLDFPSFQCASSASDNPSAADQGNCPTHPLQLLFNVGTMLKKHFVNLLSQVHERLNAHP